jgi:hypothetical protein
MVERQIETDLLNSLSLILGAIGPMMRIGIIVASKTDQILRISSDKLGHYFINSASRDCIILVSNIKETVYLLLGIRVWITAILDIILFVT